MKKTFALEDFKHTYQIRVRTYQVDLQNVVHNVYYFYYFEEAKFEYLREIGFPIDGETFITHSRYFIVRNTCEYYSPALFDHVLEIHTRIAEVGNSSVTFEHVAVDKESGALVAHASNVHVHVDTQTDRPAPIPESMRELIRAYEGEGVFKEKDEA